LANVTTTPQADDDLDAIAAYIAGDSVRRALRVIDRIETQYRKLRIFPRRGRLRPEFGPGIRSLPVSPYIVFYRVTDAGDVLIGRIIDGRRDLQTPLFF
jgi:toxin ParE1/3/4